MLRGLRCDEYGGVSCRRGAWLCGSIFAGALGLQLRGVEGAIASVGANGKGLGVVLEGVGRWLSAFVDNTKCSTLFEQRKIGVGTEAGDAARLYVAGDAQIDLVGLVTHRLKLANGDVVALCVP